MIAKMIEEVLIDVLHKTFHNPQTGVRSIVHNVLELEMLDLLRKYVIGKTLDAHIAKFSDKDEAAEGFSNMLFTSTSFMTPIATFVRGKSNTAMEEKITERS